MGQLLICGVLFFDPFIELELELIQTHTRLLKLRRRKKVKKTVTLRWVTMQLRCCSYSGCPGPPKWSKQFLITSETKTRKKDFNPQAETATATHQLSPPTKRQHWLTTLVIALSVLVNIAFFMFHDSLKPSMPQTTCKARFLAKTLRTPTKSSFLSPASKSRRTCRTDEFLANTSKIDDEKPGSFCQFEAQYQEFQRQPHHGHSQPLQRLLLIPSPLDTTLHSSILTFIGTFNFGLHASQLKEKSQKCRLPLFDDVACYSDFL